MSKSSKDAGLFPVAQPITTSDFTPNPEGPELPPACPVVFLVFPEYPVPFPFQGLFRIIADYRCHRAAIN
jgi:hypothetical protein